MIAEAEPAGDTEMETPLRHCRWRSAAGLRETGLTHSPEQVLLFSPGLSNN